MNEDDLKRKCVKWMKALELTHPFWFYSPTDHFYSGIPDTIFCAKGKFGAVELKKPGGKKGPTPIQVWTHDKIEKSGGRVLRECRDLDTFKEFIFKFFN